MTATAPDYDEIVRVVQLYVDGFNDSDMSKFKEAFDQDAWIFYVDTDGVLEKRHLADDTFSRSGRLLQGPGRLGAGLFGTQAGDAADVLLGFDTTISPGPGWGPSVVVDFHSLLRINGVWKITNKTATHATRAAWAADRNADTREAARIDTSSPPTPWKWCMSGAAGWTSIRSSTSRAPTCLATGSRCACLVR